jgi:hypothetical protein
VDWYQAGVGAACGGLAGAIGVLAGRLVKDARLKAIVVTIITVVLMTGFYSWARNTIILDHKAQIAYAEFEALTKENPAFAALQEFAPEVLDDVRAYLDEAVRDSHTALQVETNTRALIFGVVTGRLSKASDAALINSVQLSVDQMQWLHARDDDSCFRYLFPQVDGGIQAGDVFSPELIARDHESTRLILSTYDENRVVPSEEQAMAVLNPIYVALFDRHGQDRVAQLADVSASGVDRSLVCAISTDLYAMILAGPGDEALTALRWMFN